MRGCECLRGDRDPISRPNFFNRKEMLEAHDVEYTQHTRSAAYDGKLAVQVTQTLEGAKQNRQAGAIEVFGVGKIYDDHVGATINFTLKAFFKMRGRAHVNIAAGADDRSFTGAQNF